jgi:S-adenosylmethionine:tRNA ribosyltransferase-isomerase
LPPFGDAYRMDKNIILNINDFNYELPPEKIAQFPLEKRDHSKLLFYRNGKWQHDIFYNLKDHLPPGCLLVFNDTKVIHARLLFKKDTGSVIEIFCLEPYKMELQTAFQQKKSSRWNCLVGNNKRWRSGKLKIEVAGITLTAEKFEQVNEGYVIGFSWLPENINFSELLERVGKIPLPPYIDRDAEQNDNLRYQTIFARNEGSVAAPTAGLHFTEKIFLGLDEAGIKRQSLTLHVGAGTFKPVTAQNIYDHSMHEEHFSVSREFLDALLKRLREKRPVIPVGTTALRTLESIYWLGVKRILKTGNNFFLDQWEAYELMKKEINAEEAVSALLEDEAIHGITRLMIIPGYPFKIANGIITNFHQPKSTLLLLIAAMTGNRWKEAYTYALQNNFRFLSYGDCCLFI